MKTKYNIKTRYNVSLVLKRHTLSYSTQSESVTIIADLSNTLDSVIDIYLTEPKCLNHTCRSVTYSIHDTPISTYNDITHHHHFMVSKWVTAINVRDVK